MRLPVKSVADKTTISLFKTDVDNGGIAFI